MVRALESKDEVHAFADAFNWDDSHVKALFEVIRHPLCDASTAKMLYWLADPDELFLACSKRDVDSELRREHWDLLLEIETRLAGNRFRTSSLPFTPPGPAPGPEEEIEGRPIPAMLYEPCDGP